ncbi:LysM peptidoglycan-binding domain-containing protein [Marinobacter sp. V034]|uniref:LysM peptidoglycan-binding domain-containing protein n=1 Tax=Marinobacter sp. V034 TaxID=3459610 RepID=UPI0040446490
MPQYKVQPGDTLTAIAQKHQVTVADIQAQNPQITNANHIEAGWQLKIPANDSNAASMPPAKSAQSTSSTQPTCEGCAEEYAEIIHVMGADDGEWCVALPQSAADEIYTEIEEMNALMKEFKQAQDEPVDAEATSDQPSPKRKWMQKAAEKGVIAPEADEEEDEGPTKVSQVQSQIAAVDEQIKWFEDYDPDYFWSFASDDDEKRESILTTAKQKRLELLRSERKSLEGQLGKGTSSQGVKGGGVKASDFSTRSNSTEVGIIEVMVFSRPGRWYYVRKGVYKRLIAAYASIRYIKKTRAISEALKNKSGTAGQLLGKIKDDIASDAKKSLVGNIEVKFAEAKKEYYLLGEEHTKLTWSSGNGESPAENTLQVSAEAQLMRFAMQASAGVNSFDLSTGEIDIGAKASASMALAEAEAKLAEVFVPNEAGWDCRFTYKNRNGELTDLAFGAFRLSGDITLNCFVGGRLSGEANARLSTGAATFLLSDKKKIKPDPKAGLSVSGNAFAGAEAGGAIAGKFCWVHPDEQFKKNADWQELLKIEAGGTVAVGIGAGMDFQLGFSQGKILLKCKGRLVFGPGASGNFGSTIGADTVWQLMSTTLEVLEKSDFQFLSNIESDLFQQWSKSLFLGISSNIDNIETIVSDYVSFRSAWARRQGQKAEAYNLARNIKKQARDAGGSPKNLQYKGIPYSRLPPETLGMILYTLTETFIESREEDQETAILIVVSAINSWRQFIETLQHMSLDGRKVNAMGSLARICAILDDDGENSQLSKFQRWIVSSLSEKLSFTEHELAWQKIPVNLKNDRIDQRLSMLRTSQLS